MKKQNSNYDNIMVNRQPMGITARPARRGYRLVNFNDQSPEYRAMKAHLRASAYKDQRQRQAVVSIAEPESIPSNSIAPFLHLHRGYEEQARRNFVRHALLLSAFAALSAWAILHALLAMAGS